MEPSAPEGFPYKAFCSIANDRVADLLSDGDTQSGCARFPDPQQSDKAVALYP
jgi:hypothetical protein